MERDAERKTQEERERERGTQIARGMKREEEGQHRVGPDLPQQPPGQEWVTGPSFPALIQGSCLDWGVHLVHTDAPPHLHPTTAMCISHPLTQLSAPA